jgi:DNA topoisomerase-2
MVFNKKRSGDRKLWLEKYDRKIYLDTNKEIVSYTNFINKEMIHFSKYDCDRSIPNIMDGLKTSQRKIIFAAFKRNLTKEIKVAQFSGYVSEHSSYHHGEQSLNGAIVNMAQNFVGSNNINLLVPNGQFGTRLQGGSDSASERYIFTMLNKLTRTIFNEKDDKILHYLDDDGTSVEPIYYAPIIPMILVNGSKGIGTGFSTDIMSYNPIEIIEYIQNTIKKNKVDDFTFCPYFEGFKGTITKIDNQKYLVKGVYEILNKNTVKITELPVGMWTDDYKLYLEKQIDVSDKNKKTIKDYLDMSTDKNIDITITFYGNELISLLEKELEHDCNELEKHLKLYITRSETNMHLFNENEKLTKFASPKEIIDYFMNNRKTIYNDRKEYQIKNLEYESTVLSNKARFVKELLDDTIDLRKKSKEHVNKLLNQKNYNIIDDDNEFKYLVKMPMDSVTQEYVDKLQKDNISKLEELQNVKEKSVEQSWYEELDIVKKEYKTYIELRQK